MSKKLPIIFILDMDKCIIGNSKYILELYYILNEYILKNCENKKIDLNLCNINKDFWKKNISPYFIRPFFKEFIININKIFKNVEFYIFSFGTEDYVNFMIEYIEEEIDFKFKRPLFSRKDGLLKFNNDYKIKEINGLKDIIINSKYSLKEKEFIYNNRIIIIDDISEFWDNTQLIKCNPYEYTPIPYLDYSILNKIRTNDNILQYIKNSENELLPSYLQSSISFDDFFLNYHLYTCELIRNNLIINNKAIKDEFFKNLLNLLISRSKLQKPFTAKFIASINKKMII
jgi:hypothetical protein